MMPRTTHWDDLRIAPPIGRLVTAARRAPHLKADAMLAAGLGRERVYWRPPSGGAIAGFGVAASIFGYGSLRMHEIAEQARALFDGASIDPEAPPQARPRLFGGFAFRDDFVPDEAWSAFHPAHFLLPHVQFVQDDDGAGGWLTLAALAGPDDGVDDTRAALRAALDVYVDRVAAAPIHASRDDVFSDVRYPMDFTAWSTLVQNALTEIDAGRIAKVVLARACELRSAKGFELARAAAQLDEQYPECYRFLFEPRPGHVFLGATPELLTRTEGHVLQTMALAGSQARGATAEQDAALGAELLHSDKDRREHQLVLDALIDRLHPIAAHLTSGATTLMRLHNIQHLYTPVQAELLSPGAILATVETLHPTPALGGAPRETALRFIYENEPLTRGWYAAPFGWLDDAFDGEFCVAIRSAVVQEKRAWLYAGCGIVAGSQPQREWDETSLKFRPMLRALGGESPRSEKP